MAGRAAERSLGTLLIKLSTALSSQALHDRTEKVMRRMFRKERRKGWREGDVVAGRKWYKWIRRGRRRKREMR